MNDDVVFPIYGSAEVDEASIVVCEVGRGESVVIRGVERRFR